MSTPLASGLVALLCHNFTEEDREFVIKKCELDSQGNGLQLLTVDLRGNYIPLMWGKNLQTQDVISKCVVRSYECKGLLHSVVHFL